MPNCQFFVSAAGCGFGADCRFDHVADPNRSLLSTAPPAQANQDNSHARSHGSRNQNRNRNSNTANNNSTSNNNTRNATGRSHHQSNDRLSPSRNSRCALLHRHQQPAATAHIPIVRFHDPPTAYEGESTDNSSHRRQTHTSSASRSDGQRFRNRPKSDSRASPQIPARATPSPSSENSNTIGTHVHAGSSSQLSGTVDPASHSLRGCNRSHRGNRSRSRNHNRGSRGAKNNLNESHPASTVSLNNTVEGASVSIPSPLSTSDSNIANTSRHRQPPAHRPAFQRPIPKSLQDRFNHTTDPLCRMHLQRDIELGQLERRYRSSGYIQSESTYSSTPDTTSTSRSSTTVHLDLVPTDPDFPYDLAALHISLLIPDLFPTDRACRLVVLNKEIPAHLGRNIERAWMRKVEASKIGLLALLNWLDTNLESLFIERDDGIITSFQGHGRIGESGAGRVGMSGVIPAAWAIGSSSQSISDSGSGNAVLSPPSCIDHSNSYDDEDDGEKESDDDDDDDVDDDDGDDDDEADEDAGDGNGGVLRSVDISIMDEIPGYDDTLEDEFDHVDDVLYTDDLTEIVQDLTTSLSALSTCSTTGYIKRGTQIRLPSTRLDGISLLHCTSISLTIRCVRCKDTAEVLKLLPSPSETSPDTQSIPCKTCQTMLSVAFRRDFMHPTSTCLGYLDLHNATAFDLGPGTYVSTCSVCDAEHVYPHLPTLTPVTLHCRSCHAATTLQLGQVKFNAVGAGHNVTHASHLSKQARKKHLVDKKKLLAMGISVGSPLPSNGASCSHFKTSYRWFRFGCCGMIYPCSTCHETLKRDTHEMVWASRQFCGFCSREQAYNGIKPCIACGKDLTKRNRGSGFWEGGKGTRDQSRLSSKDSRKFRGLGKTKSQKAMNKAKS
ncbi:hypothetical protein BSLG_004341 [Batrachochytrium salamandrivorans]|nr:hypothetical protein BSLG_004341 [Batrachochytrium salamandrivorans]